MILPGPRHHAADQIGPPQLHTTFPYDYLDATYVHVRDDALG